MNPDLTAEELRKYVTYAKRKVCPTLNSEAASVLQGHYIKIRQKMLEVFCFFCCFSRRGFFVVVVVRFAAHCVLFDLKN